MYTAYINRWVMYSERRKFDDSKEMLEIKTAVTEMKDTFSGVISKFAWAKKKN